MLFAGEVFKMNRSAIITIALFTIFVATNAWCFSWMNKPGRVTLCKKPGKAECVEKRSGDVCVNLYGEDYVSGFTGGYYICQLFHYINCNDFGDIASLDIIGYDNFEFKPMSFRCPCVFRYPQKLQDSSINYNLTQIYF